MTTLAVVIPATDAPPTLARCLAAIRAAADAPDEVVVVDGPASLSAGGARNAGVERATADVVVFVDADVAVRPDAFTRLRAAFASDRDLVAVYGSYDDSPADRATVSAFRNLLHHHVHQSGAGPAETFWTGLGAVRRSDFLAVGGFDEARYPHPSIEDIDFGHQLAATGARIVLDPAIQGTHLKVWTLRSMLWTDFARRGIPWVALQVAQPTGVERPQLRLAPPPERGGLRRRARVRGSRHGAARARRHGRPARRSTGPSTCSSCAGSAPCRPCSGWACTGCTTWSSVAAVPAGLAAATFVWATSARQPRTIVEPARRRQHHAGPVSSPFALGLVGCGRLAEAGYVPAITQVPGVRLVAVADPDPSRRTLVARLATASGIGPVDGAAVSTFADAASLLQGGAVDGVVLATPAAAHRGDAERAAAAGVATLVEKPPRWTPPAPPCLAAISPAPWVGFNRRFDPGAAAVRAAVPGDGDVELRLEIGYRRAELGRAPRPRRRAARPRPPPGRLGPVDHRLRGDRRGVRRRARPTGPCST